jgi:uncharacterized protein YdhG (YjbR/CyaY superfamily)
MKKSKDVDLYIARHAGEVQRRLKTLRSIVAKAAPRAEEGIAYGIPGYKLAGRPLVYFGGFARHVSLFALPSGTAAFKKELAKYKTSKGTVQFPLDEPLPLALIARIVGFRVRENLARSEKR